MTLTSSHAQSLPLSDLRAVAARLVTGGRGILAADESIRTMNERLLTVGVDATPEHRRDYRQLLLTAAGLSTCVSGVIWCEETFGQRLTDGREFPIAARELGVLPGIKVDTGTVALPGTTALVTQGLDGLDERLADFAAAGAAFAKWRAVFDITTLTPYVARANAHALARYAALCQRHGIVPIVEPELLADGPHDLIACAAASRQVMGAVFEELAQAEVDLSGVVLKPSFVTPGLRTRSATARTVATVTCDVLRETVPPDVAGIAFLSGGHSTADACDYLSALNRRGRLPWPTTFSFGRALVSEALETWAGSPAHVSQAQHALIANCQRAATATLSPRG